MDKVTGRTIQYARVRKHAKKKIDGAKKTHFLIIQVQKAHSKENRFKYDA